MARLAAQKFSVFEKLSFYSHNKDANSFDPTDVTPDFVQGTVATGAPAQGRQGPDSTFAAHFAIDRGPYNVPSCMFQHRRLPLDIIDLLAEYVTDTHWDDWLDMFALVPSASDEQRRAETNAMFPLEMPARDCREGRLLRASDRTY